MTTIMVKAGIAALWVVLAVDAISGGRLMGGDQPARMLLLAVTITATSACCTRHMQLPAAEIFSAGREYERRVMLREMNECKVLPFDRSGS